LLVLTFGDRLQHLLDTLLELTAILGTRHERVDAELDQTYLCLSTPERNCIGGPEQKSLTQASKKAPDIGGLLAFGGLSPGWRRRSSCVAEAGVIGAWSG